MTLYTIRFFSGNEFDIEVFGVIWFGCKNESFQVQMLEYMVQIWWLHRKQTPSKALPLPVILPLLFYYGPEKWNLDTRFSSLFSCPVEALKRFIPDFEITFFNLSRYSDEKIRGKILTRAGESHVE